MSSSSTDRPPTENQLAPHLPGPKVLVTSHNDEGKAVVKETAPVKVRWEYFLDTIIMCI